MRPNFYSKKKKHQVSSSSLVRAQRYVVNGRSTVPNTTTSMWTVKKRTKMTSKPQFYSPKHYKKHPVYARS